MLAKPETIQDYLPSDYTINKYALLDGLRVNVFPAWSIMVTDRSIRLTSIAEESVWVEIEPKTGDVDTGGFDRKTRLSGLDRTIYYSFDNREEGLALRGACASADPPFVVSGHWDESTKLGKMRAGEIWQMLHWIQSEKAKKKK